MSNSTSIAAVLAVLAFGSVQSFAQTAPAKTVESPNGKILVDTKGMTLYTLDKDTPGKSTCTGTCIQNWPALAAPKDAHGSGDWSVVARDDGSMQWAYKTKPLYTFVKDTKAGDMTGNGVGKVWHVATP